jgi:RNA polymerase sigma-70 factor, ECF subfamily
MIAFASWWNTAKQAATTDEDPTPRLTPEHVFHNYAGRVYNLARRMLEHEADAEDVTQEVLLQVVRKLETFRGDAELSTWLHRITVNAVLAHRRKRAVRAEVQTASPLESLADGGDGASAGKFPATPDSQALRRETRQMIERAIAALPAIYRDVLVLSDVEQFTNPQIGEMLGLSLPAVKSRLHRARQLMRSALAPHFQEIGA